MCFFYPSFELLSRFFFIAFSIFFLIFPFITFLCFFLPFSLFFCLLPFCLFLIAFYCFFAVLLLVVDHSLGSHATGVRSQLLLHCDICRRSPQTPLEVSQVKLLPPLPLLCRYDGKNKHKEAKRMLFIVYFFLY